MLVMDMHLVECITSLKFEYNYKPMPIAYYRTPVGITRITQDDDFISAISIRDEEYEITPASTPLLQMAINQLEEYFAGKRKTFDFPIRQPGTTFQQEVWEIYCRLVTAQP